MSGKSILVAIILVILLFSLIVSIGLKGYDDIDIDTNQTFDALSMYSDYASKTTLTVEELKIKIGEPESVETWDYEKNAKTKYSITTLSYENGDYEYHFYDNHLARISINKEVALKNNKNLNPSIFNLKVDNNTTLNDTGAALRYYNCKVHDIWFQNITDNVASQVQISYIDLL